MSEPPRAFPRLHVVTDDEVVRAAGFGGAAARVLRAGGPALALHLRHRGTAQELYALAVDLAERARRSGAALIVNRRVDVALACAAHGVHLGRRSIPAASARTVLGGGAWVGRSVHRVAELDRLDAAVDYALLGAIFPTASHPGGHPLGLDALALAAARTRRPVLAIGGVDEQRVPGCLRAGAYGVAVLGAVWSARSPERAAEALIDRLEAET